MDISNIGSNALAGAAGGQTAGQAAGQAARAAQQSQDESFEKRLNEAMQSKDEKELKSVCQQFESIMLNMMYKQMKATVMKSDLIQEDPGTEIFQSMLDDNLMDQASKTGSFGLAESLYKQLSKQTKSGGNGDGSEKATDARTAGIPAEAKSEAE